MYNAFKGKVGEYSNRVRLEVGVEFIGGYPEGQCCPLKTDILGFRLG